MAKLTEKMAECLIGPDMEIIEVGGESYAIEGYAKGIICENNGRKGLRFFGYRLGDEIDDKDAELLLATGGEDYEGDTPCEHIVFCPSSNNGISGGSLWDQCIVENACLL